MALTINELRFLRDINNSNLTVKELAKDKNMTTRNIRYKIDNLNLYLNTYLKKRISIENGIVSIDISKEEENKLFQLVQNSSLRFNKDERQEIIINMYLFKRGITFSKLEKMLFVTRTTLNKDIKEINKKIKNRNIRLDLVGKNICLIGNEKKLRHYKAEQLSRYTTLNNKQIEVIQDTIPSSELISHMIQYYLNRFPINNVRNCIDHIERLLNVKFEKGFYKMIFLYLIVTIERIDSKFVITRKNNEEFLINLIQYEILKKTLNTIVPLELKYEYLHLTEYFISGYSSKRFANSEFAISTFTNNILNELGNKMNIKFINSTSLIEDITEYLNPALYRIKNNFAMNDAIDIKSVNQDIFNEVLNICKENNNLLPELLRKEEVFYISKIIEDYIKYEKSKVINLSDLLGIILKNSKEVDQENLKLDLLKGYKHLLIEDV